MGPIPELAIIPTLNAKIFRCISINRTGIFQTKKSFIEELQRLSRLSFPRMLEAGQLADTDEVRDWLTEEENWTHSILNCVSLETSEVWTVCCRPGRIARAPTPWTRVRFARTSLLQVQRLADVRWVSMEMIGKEFKENIFYSDSFLDKTLEKTLTTQILFCCRISAPKKMN